MLNNKTRVENVANHGIDLAHKNQELSRYLDSISHNLREKTQLVEYVERYPNGTFVEIGTGGDPLKELLSALPINLNPTIIACDINPDVLESLIARNPELREFMCESENGPKLETRVVNAVSMPFQDESISGLNLSAVFHEIYSYSGGNEAVIKSFEESYRVLEKEGILLYRDPEHIDNPEDIVNMDLKTRDAKLLTNLFLAKFLDHQFTCLKDSNGRSIKPNTYSQDIVRFRYYPKDSDECTELSFSEYLKIPSRDIDFSKSVSLTAPRGLCREIERHFITFLYDCNPLVFAKLTKSDDTDSHKISFLTDKIAKTFSTFVNRSDIEMVDNRITEAGKNKIEEEIYFRTKYMEFGVPVGLPKI